MMEVTTGSKPGRPRVAMLFLAAVLAAMLGLAYFQSEVKNAPRDPIKIKGTPISVQIPAGWIQSERNPSVFYLPANEALTRLGVEFAMRLEIGFVPGYRDALAGDQTAKNILIPKGGTRIGKYPARQVSQQVDASHLVGVTIIIREAISPRGDLVRMQFHIPTLKGKPISVAAIDTIAESVSIDHPGMDVSAKEAMERAKVTFDVDPTWQFSTPHLELVEGCYVGDAIAGNPAWSLEILRTWRAYGRSPEDILHDAALDEWDLLPDDVTITTSQTQSMKIHTATPKWIEGAVARILLIERSPSDVLIVRVRVAYKSFLSAAQEALEKIVGSLQFDSASFVNVDECEGAGISAVRRIRERGMVPWWGQGGHTSYFLDREHPKLQQWVFSRMPINSGIDNGYVGYELGIHPGMQFLITSYTNADTSEYSQEFREFAAEAKTGQRRLDKLIIDSNVGDKNTVLRIRKAAKGEMKTRFPVGPGWAGWGAEQGVEYLVASGHFSKAMISCPDVNVHGDVTRLLRTLPSSASNAFRVLTQQDSDPIGQILTFDTNGEYTGFQMSHVELVRVDKSEAQRANPQDLVRLQEECQEDLRRRAVHPSSR